VSEGGTLVTYGAMSRQPVRAPNGLLIFRDVRFWGFWVSRWYAQASAAESGAMFEELFASAKHGLFNPPIARTYRLQEAAAALTHAAEGSRAGKILFAPSGESARAR
jgi:NADPH:quinone reductase-like Zn-dependent oxidoreductase